MSPGPIHRAVIKRFRSFPSAVLEMDNPVFVVGRNGAGKLESLRGQCRIAHDAEAPPDPEGRRDAKEALEEHMPRGASYAPTVHQGRLSATFDMALAYCRNRSFRKFTKAVGELLVQMRQPLADWPPAAWRA